MEIFTTIMLIVTRILTVYSILVFARIMLTWLPLPQLDRVKSFLGTIVDPFLNIFRSINWLRIGMFDFSPMVGLILLSVTIKITAALSNPNTAQNITPITILVILIQNIWGLISFFLLILIVLLIVRLVVSLSNNGMSNSWGNIDSMIYNLMARVVGFFTQKSVSFHTGLLITIGVLVVLRIGLTFLISFLLGLLISL